MQSKNKGRYLLFREIEHDYKSEYLEEDERYLLIDTLDYKGYENYSYILGSDVLKNGQYVYRNYNGGIISVLDLRGYTLTIQKNKLQRYEIVVSNKGFIFIKVYKRDKPVYSEYTGLVYYKAGIVGLKLEKKLLTLKLDALCKNFLYYELDDEVIGDGCEYNSDSDVNLGCKYDDKKYILTLKKKLVACKMGKRVYSKEYLRLTRNLLPGYIYSMTVFDDDNKNKVSGFKKVILTKDLYFTIRDSSLKEAIDLKNKKTDYCKLHLLGIREYGKNIYLYTCRGTSKKYLTLLQFLYVEGRVYGIKSGFFTWKTKYGCDGENSLYIIDNKGTPFNDPAIKLVKNNPSVLNYYMEGLTYEEFLEVAKYLPTLCEVDDCEEYLKEIIGRDIEFYRHLEEPIMEQETIWDEPKAKVFKEIPKEAIEFISNYIFPRLNGQG